MGETDINAKILLPSVPAIRPLVLTFDPEAFRDYLEDFEMSQEDEAAFLEALWSILVGFVDLGFEIHPVQQATCAARPENLAPDSGAMLASTENSIKNNNDMAESRLFGQRAGRE